MTPDELKRMRKPLSVGNLKRIKRLLGKIDLALSTRCRDVFEMMAWHREVADELASCLAIMHEWEERRHG